MKPLAVDLYAGLGGWTDGLLAEGYRVVGFDIERHDYGTGGYPAQLVLQDVLTIHGSQFKDAALIVASPPCQEYSYMAMPWSRGKQIARALRGQGDFPEGYTGSRTLPQLTALFDACFRIQHEAVAAAGHHIPLVVENVRGAQKWVGRSRWNYGSFHLWGDVPALMPMTARGRMKAAVTHRDGDEPFLDFRKSFQTASVEGFKGVPHKPTGHWTNPEENGTKQGGDWFNAEALDKDGQQAICRRSGSKSPARKAASAMIAKIPLTLSRHIAYCFNPDTSTLRKPTTPAGIQG